MFKILRFLTPAAGGWYLLLGAIALTAFVSGGGAWRARAVLADRDIARVQAQYDAYKVQVLQRDVSSGQAVLDEIRRLSGSLRQIEQAQSKQQIQDQAFSDNLIKELSNASSKSCPLSPAVESYLDRLRDEQARSRSRP